MANNFDSSKYTDNKAAASLNIQDDKNKSNTNSNSQRSAYKNVWTRQPSSDADKQTSSPDEQQSPVFIIEQKTKPYWETGEDEGHGAEQTSSYYQQEYYNYENPYKKKGVSNKIDRFVQRFPVLGRFYKQPPSVFDSSEPGQQFNYDEMFNSIVSNSITNELTADDLTLNERYSDKRRIQYIKLQAKDQTQPVDISIHHQTNKIYLCDVGRSLVEIFDINGTREHVISGTVMSKFQPTAIVVASDRRLIVASYFNHCLHMYYPNDTSNQVNCYSYKQFKLGTKGNQIHQFYNPAGIAVDNSDGYLYVCDRGNYRVQVITPDGICERIIELFIHNKKNYPLDPVQLAFQPKFGRLVCIIGGTAICFIPKYTNGPVYVNPLYITDTNGLGLDNASGLAIDTHDRIFISDTDHHRIVICTPDGYFITSFGMEGCGLGQLKRPCGLDITNDGTVVVTDSGNKRIQLFGLIRERTPVTNNPRRESSNVNSGLFLIEEHDLAATM
ncbi:unnamed protein product [Rotaria sordida]|uniref:Uncharacterized protein n=1 Tax=Rotaria sordida TaxID=392033 RepID=A0A818WD22_9BILA|nr:unnamed protein product [Rotaria sordida]CAF1177893.1 unnamed protein product [Rotaria sordida]CAF1202958.1 unnamed protein product [Rotaria sordida]CAF1437001.1 unnamed protein product [Rotaria sordida]CAF3724192.1 unnamed protein product [Rotaria sordida]